MTGESTPGWAFLVARGRQVGYQLLLVPDFVAANRESGLLMDEVRGEVPAQGPPRVTGIAGPASGPLCVVHRTVRATRADVGATDQPTAPLLDRAGRPLVLAYGFVCRGVRVVTPDDLDLRAARDAAVATYQRFHAAEDTFLPEASHQYLVHSIVEPAGAPPRPAVPRSTAPWTSQILPSPQVPARPRRLPPAIVLALIGVLALLGVAAGISVSTSVRQVGVPDVVGKTRADAVREITQAGLVPEIESASSTRPCGIVFTTRPKPRHRVDRNSKVYLMVSTGPARPGESLDCVFW